MSRGGIWRTLGIDPTEDLGTIRRAYAQALRALDPDADPDGFARLRAARDRALALAREGARVEPQPPPAERHAPDPEVAPGLNAALLAPVLAPGGAGPLAIPHPAAASLPPLTDARADGGEGAALALPRHDWAAPVIAAAAGDVAVLPASAAQPYDAAFAELLHLLQGDGEPPVGRAEALVRFLFDDPRLERLAFAEDAERWFAAVLADAIPRSDPVLALVADRFGWSREVGSIALSDAAERVAERARSLAYAAAAAGPEHPDHRLWAELIRPAHEKSRRGWLIRARRMRDYLATIRRSYPDAEGSFDPMRVALWDRARVAQPNRWAWGIGIFLFLRALGAFIADDHRPDLAPNAGGAPTVIAGPTIVADREGDIDLALLSFADGLTLARVRRENPGLADAVTRRWRDAATRRETVAAFMAETRRDLVDRVNGAMAHARYEDVAALRRMDLAELAAVNTRGSDQCARLLAGTLPLAEIRTRDTDSQRRQILAAILLSDPKPTASKTPRTFTISGPVMVRLERATDLTRASLVAALDRRGPTWAQCNARRALLRAALDLPRAAGLPLLRGL